MMARWILTRLVMAAGGVAVALLLAELALRVLGVSYFRVHLFDEHVGAVRPPNVSGWYTQEGRAFIRTNSAGLRDREHTLAKPPNTFRIAVLGDSFAEALTLPQEKAFWALIERDLGPSCPSLGGRNVEVINFGLSGYGTAQELLTLRHRAAAYAPDAVLLAFYVGNDVEDNSKQLSAEQLRPFFVHKDGQLALDDSFTRLPEFQSRRTAFADFLYGTLIPNVRLLQLVNEARASIYLAGADATGPGGPTVFNPPTDPRWVEAWSVTDDLLVMTREEAASRGARFLVAVIAEPHQALPDPAARAAFAQKVGVADLDYPQSHLIALGQRTGIAMLDLLPPFRTEAQRRGAPLYGYPGEEYGLGHWNADGHALAAETIAPALCRLTGG